MFSYILSYLIIQDKWSNPGLSNKLLLIIQCVGWLDIVIRLSLSTKCELTFGTKITQHLNIHKFHFLVFVDFSCYYFAYIFLNICIFTRGVDIWNFQSCYYFAGRHRRNLPSYLSIRHSTISSLRIDWSHNTFKSCFVVFLFIKGLHYMLHNMTDGHCLHILNN